MLKEVVLSESFVDVGVRLPLLYVTMAVHLLLYEPTLLLEIEACSGLPLRSMLLTEAELGLLSRNG